MRTRRSTRAILFAALVLLVLTLPAIAQGKEMLGPQGEMVRVLLALVVMLIAAKVGGDLSIRIGQPPVLGELFLGLIIGSLGLLHFRGLEFIKTDEAVEVLSQIGVILLLFEVGLESDLGEFLRVGPVSFLVAAVGVVTPFGLGYLVAVWLLPQESAYAHVFIGAILTATSVGITARVLRDLGKVQTIEAKIILGAAVIDDVMGLVVLAVVQGMIMAANSGGHGMSPAAVVWIGMKALLFLGIALVAGVYVAPKVFRAASKLRSSDVLLAISLSGCFLFAYVAGKIGLAPIVGAFAAGLVLEEVHYRDLPNLGERNVEDLIRPITGFLVPIFFVLMGLRVDLSAMAQPGVAVFGGLLILAAVIGKQSCALVAIGRGVDKISVGVGMIPRGEVGLIFAAIGATLKIGGEPVVAPPVFAAVIIMVMVTTFITPPLLRYTMLRSRNPHQLGKASTASNTKQ